MKIEIKKTIIGTEHVTQVNYYFKIVLSQCAGRVAQNKRPSVRCVICLHTYSFAQTDQTSLHLYCGISFSSLYDLIYDCSVSRMNF